MVGFLKGKVDIVGLGYMIIDTGGVGYTLSVPDSLSTKYIIGDDVKLYTHMSVSENNVALYGFDKHQDVSFFQLLTSVSGIGPKAGMALMSVADATTLALAIVQEDIDLITKANGIGKKIAQRLVLELRDRLKKITSDLPTATAKQITADSIGAPQHVTDATDALLALGYNPKEVYSVVSKVDKSTTTEDIIKAALKELS